MAIIFIIVSILLVYIRLPLTYFQQDEWYGFGQAIVMTHEGFGNLFSVLGSFHFTPLSVGLYSSVFYIFGLHAQAYAIVAIISHIMTTLVVYILAKIFFKNKVFATIAAAIFGLGTAHQQAITWFGTTMATIPAAFFGCISIICFLIALKIKNQTWAYFASLLLLFFGLGFKEDILGMFPFYIFLLLWNKQKMRYVYVFSLSGITYFTIRSIIQLQGTALAHNTTQSHYVLNVIIHIFEFSIKGFSYVFIPPTLGLKISYLLFNLAPSFFMKFSRTSSSGLFVENSIFPFLIYVSFAIFIFLFLFAIKLQKDIKKEWLFLMIFFFCSILPLSLLPSYATLESRHLYFSMISGSLILTYIIKAFVIKVKPNKKLIPCIFLLFWMMANIAMTKQQMQFLLTQSAQRKQLIANFEQYTNSISAKTIFLSIGDPLPLQTGPGELLMVLFYKKENYSYFFKQGYLWNTQEGYFEKNGVGFGYFEHTDLAVQAAKKYHIPLSRIYTFSWDSKTQKLTDVTKQERKKFL